MAKKRTKAQPHKAPASQLGTRKGPKTLLGGQTTLRRAVEPKRLASDELRLLTFVDHYRRTFNATDSAIAAGYAVSFASSAGSRLLHDHRVQELLARHALDQIAATNIRVEDILRATSEIAYADPGQCFQQLVDSKTGIVTLRLLDIVEMPVAVRRTISGFKVVKKNLTSGDGFIDTVIEVKFWNKNEALKLLAMYKSLLTQKADEMVTAKQLEKMSDEQLAQTQREALEKWERHLAARARSRLALVGNP